MKMAAFLLFVLVGFLRAGVPPLAASAEMKWKLLVSNEDEFSVNVPSTVNYGRGLEEDRFVGGRAEFHSDTHYFFVFVDPAKDPTQFLGVSKYIEHIGQLPQSFLVDGKEAARYEFVDTDGYFHRIVTVQTNERKYVFHALSRIKDDPKTKFFVDSIRIGRPEFAEQEVIPPPDSDPRPTGSGSSGAGKNPNTTGSPSTPSDSKPLILTSKPKSTYTEFARLYNITGHVALRVTFLANGKIGEVTVVRYLPFGLTRSSIEAIQKWTFEPQTIDGKPQTTTRPVMVGYTIY